MKSIIRQYIGIFLGALYGISIRWFWEKRELFDSLYKNENLYSISFLWILPIAIGLIPILFAKKEVLESKYKGFLFPFLSVLLFFLFALTSGLEDWICILIISMPFSFSAGLIGAIVRATILQKKTKELYSILFLPLLLNPIESYFRDQIETKEVKTSIEISASSKKVWQNLIEVPEIKNDEFNPGFYNFIGIPRPIKSKLKNVNGKIYRIGYFTEGLELYETISKIDTLQFVEFEIDIQKSKLRNLPMDNHLLKGKSFKFNNISYRVIPLENNKTQLILNCEYTLTSKMNWYSNFWAKSIIKDFEERLITSLKLKLEANRY